MPFTPAHAVVALPFARSRRVPPAAVACGAVAPDLPLYLTGGAGYDATHALWAVPTLDVLLGLACLLAWWGVLRVGLVAVLPGAVRARIGPPAPAPKAVVPVAIAGGALTHVVWDGFTHPGRFGTMLLPVLQQHLGPLPLTSWAQAASGVLGLALLAAASVRWFRRARPTASSRPSDLGRAAPKVAAAVVVAPVVVAPVAAVVARSTDGDGSAHGAAYSAAVALVLALVASIAASGAFARIAAVRARGGRGAPSARG